jgi:putative FmdB family regulatory protein
MPIYEYHCDDCQKHMSLFIRSISNPTAGTCRFCHSSRLSRLISRVVTPKSEQSRMERLGDPAALSGLTKMTPRAWRDG